MTPPRSTSRTRSIKRLAGSSQARRLATVVLEVLGGVATPGMASTAAGISLQRYYAVEARALNGLIAALEPRPRGRHRRPEDELVSLTRQRERLVREVSRLQALVRATHRSAGLPEAKASSRPGKRRARRASPRAVRAVKILREASASSDTAPASPAEQEA